MKRLLVGAVLGAALMLPIAAGAASNHGGDGSTPPTYPTGVQTNAQITRRLNHLCRLIAGPVSNGEVRMARLACPNVYAPS